jgi:hypothetical protein
MNTAGGKQIPDDERFFIEYSARHKDAEAKVQIIRTDKTGPCSRVRLRHPVKGANAIPVPVEPEVRLALATIAPAQRP